MQHKHYNSNTQCKLDIFGTNYVGICEVKTDYYN